MKTKALFLDKDGIINKLHYDTELGVIHTPLNRSQVEFVFGIFDFLKTAKSRGYLLIIVSNQPNIGIKKMSLNRFNDLKMYIKKVLKKEGIALDGEYYCLHHPFATVRKYKKNCRCRKPNTLLYEKAIEKFNVNINESWAIGDGVFDIIAGSSIGLKTILLSNTHESVYSEEFENRLKDSPPTYIVKNLKEAQEIISKS